MTAPDKPTIDQQIAFQNAEIKDSEEHKWKRSMHYQSAILSTLRAHKRITESVSEQILQSQLAELQAKHDALVRRLREPTTEILTEMAYQLNVVPRGSYAGDWLQHMDRQYRAAMTAVALKGGE